MYHGWFWRRSLQVDDGLGSEGTRWVPEQNTAEAIRYYWYHLDDVVRVVLVIVKVDALRHPAQGSLFTQGSYRSPAKGLVHKAGNVWVDKLLAMKLSNEGLVDSSPNAEHRYRGLYCESGFPLDVCEEEYSLDN